MAGKKLLLCCLLLGCLWNSMRISLSLEWRDPVPSLTPKEMMPLPSTPNLQMFLIAFHQADVDGFVLRNQESGIGSNIVSWFPAVNGYNQEVLNEWATQTGWKPLNATKHDPTDPNSKRGYDKPHHVGCFMSHVQLLRSALNGWRNAVGARPDALFVFEEDASCIKDTVQKSLQTISSLPADWDLLYIGGKPFSYHHDSNMDHVVLEKMAKKQGILKAFRKDPRKNMPSIQDLSQSKFRALACKNEFGRSSTGPFAPDESRNLSAKQPFWRTKYITNTQSYVINPKRIERVLAVLDEPQPYMIPVDIVLANSLKESRLKAFVPAGEYLCDQSGVPTIEKINPTPWRGLYYHKQLQGNFWDLVMLESCPGKF